MQQLIKDWLNKLVTELDIENSISDSCDCKDSKYCYQPAGHIVTGDLKVITDSRIRSIICKGLNIGFLYQYTSNPYVRKLQLPYKNFVIAGVNESLK